MFLRGRAVRPHQRHHPCPGSSHAVAQTIREAWQAKEDVKLSNHKLSDQDLAKGLGCLEGLPKPEAALI